MAQSSRFVVATHILTLLASGNDEVRTSASIAASVNTNPVVVRRLLGLLLKAHLVIAREGANGGFRLAKAPSAIDLREVYTAVEPDSLFKLHRQDPNPDCEVGRTIQAVISPSLDAAEEALLRSLEKTKLTDLVGR